MVISPGRIKRGMPVVCSNDVRFATVHYMAGDWIELEADERGNRHFIPLSWVRSLDDELHIDRPGKQAMQQWSSTPSFEGFGSASRISLREVGAQTATARKRDW